MELTVFTTFRNIDFLDECITSVLSQSFRDFEFLLINDGSAENEKHVRRTFDDPRIRIITADPPLGLVAARNAGLRAARGDLIAIIDSDDFCEPGRLQKQIDFMRAHPDHVLVGSWLRFVDHQSRTIGTRRYPENDPEIKSRMVVLNCIAQPAVMARRQLLIDAGGYTNDYKSAEDYDLWLRAARLGKFHNIPEVLLAYRIHPGASKNLGLRPALRDTTRLKIVAIRRYGFPATPRAIASIVSHALLLLLPSRITFWLFKKIMITKPSVAP